jgi:hypothetical protein
MDGLRLLVEARDFSPLRIQTEFGFNQPPIQWVKEVLTPGLKRTGHEAYHSPLSSAEVKMVELYFPICPHDVVLINLSTRTILLLPLKKR